MLPDMIRRPRTLSPHGVPPVPTWVRRASASRKDIADQGFEEIAVAAGATIGALDTLMRRQHKWAGAWRQRLALAAAANTTRQMGRTEDEGVLRDTVLLTRPGDDVGPAGLLLMAWRRLATQPPKDLLAEASLATVLEEFGHHPADTPGELADGLEAIAASEGTVSAVAGALALAERYNFGHPFGAWLADALLAQRLGWSHALPLLGSEPSSARANLARRARGMTRRTDNQPEPEQIKKLLAAQARAALRAIDLAAELERRAEKLKAAAPRLRAKGADRVIEKLLADDAITASQHIPGMSDRGLRRLFDRLVSLGAVRELTGRSTFRIYGL